MRRKHQPGCPCCDQDCIICSDYISTTYGPPYTYMTVSAALSGSPGTCGAAPRCPPNGTYTLYGVGEHVTNGCYWELEFSSATCGTGSYMIRLFGIGNNHPVRLLSNHYFELKYTWDMSFSGMGVIVATYASTDFGRAVTCEDLDAGVSLSYHSHTGSVSGTSCSTASFASLTWSIDGIPA